MTIERLDLLNERERQCLRLVGLGYNTKEIARLCDLSANRVAKVIDSANQKLGQSSRRVSARILADAEQGGVCDIPGTPFPLPAARHLPELSASPEVASHRGIREERMQFDAPGDLSQFGWPSRKRGGQTNDLTTAQRLIWIVLISAIGFLGIGALAAGLGALSDQIILVPSGR